MSKKRLFQILDEMNVNDGTNKTATCACCFDMVSANTAKGGAHVTMGVPTEALHKIMNDEYKPMLVLLDMKEYHRLDATPASDELQTAIARAERAEKLIEQLNNQSFIKGVPGATWGDTEYDSMASAAGYNQAIMNMKTLLVNALIPKTGEDE